MSQLDTFQLLLKKGQDNALLRYSLGNEYLKLADYAQAIIHFKKAVALKPDYSAAWKLYAKTLAKHGDKAAAIAAYNTGIAVAQKNGDKQAVKEMQVFLNRLNAAI